MKKEKVRYSKYEEVATVCVNCKFAEKHFYYRKRSDFWYLRCTRHTKRQIDVVTGEMQTTGYLTCREENDGHCKYWEQKEETK